MVDEAVDYGCDDIVSEGLAPAPEDKVRGHQHQQDSRLAVPDRIDHLPGQHYVVRLTAPDGYVAQRSYSVASDPSDPLVELWVERLDDGEISTFLADAVGADGYAADASQTVKRAKSLLEEKRAKVPA